MPNGMLITIHRSVTKPEVEFPSYCGLLVKFLLSTGTPSFEVNPKLTATDFCVKKLLKLETLLYGVKCISIP